MSTLKISPKLKRLFDKVLEEYSNESNLIENKRKLRSILNRSLSLRKEVITKLAFKKNHDFLGLDYQSESNCADRREMGRYYTPLKIVQYILNQIGYSIYSEVENKKIIDLSCGSGSFLIQAVKNLTIRLLFELKVENINEVDSNQALFIIKKVRNNIFGIDKDPFACILCQINMILVLFPLFTKIHEEDELGNFLLFNIKNVDAIEYYSSYFPSINEKDKYDYVVGNPPYVFIRDISVKEKNLIDQTPLKTKRGQYDLYQIFIEIGLDHLKEHGYLGYIIPDSLLALSYREDIRRFIYNTTEIKQIYLTGPEFHDAVVSNVILILKKNTNVSLRENNIINMISSTNKKRIPQSIIKKWNYMFLLNFSEIDSQIITYLNKKFLKLKELDDKLNIKVDLGRGVELSKEGEIFYCKKCDRFYPIPKNRLNCIKCNVSFNKNNFEKIIVDLIPKGEESNYAPFVYLIERYRVKMLKYINIHKKGINYKQPELYEDRIIIRQIGEKNLICATYKKEYALTSQSLYNLKIDRDSNSEFNHYYLLGLINSKLLSFYFMKSFGSYKKLFPRILIEKIKELPLKLPISTKEKELAIEIQNGVKKLLKSEQNAILERNQIQDLIDNLVYQLYKINVSFRNHINQYYQN